MLHTRRCLDLCAAAFLASRLPPTCIPRYSGGGHAFSRDGTAWTWTGTAFDNCNVTRADGLVAHYNGDRPKLLFGRDGTTPIALTNGVGFGFPAGATGMDADQTFTLLQPLASVTSGP